MTTKGVVVRVGRKQGLDGGKHGIYNFGLECAHDGVVLHRVVVVGSHSGSNPSQPDDRWMVTNPRGS
jgi:hypothetical protein